MFGTPFEIFGTVHVITIVVIAFVSILLPKFYKGKADEQISLMKKIIAGVIAAHVIISPYKDLYLLANPYDWRETIPLHMCDLSEIFLIWFLLGGPKILYLCAFFWGLGGATMAILTPDISHHDLDYIFFMIGHGMIIVGKPANFWYLMAKPDGASLMDVFPDPPYHLLYTTPLAIAVFYLIYLPYFIKDNFAK